ncbi:MAG: hypothetical protein CSA62_01075 [Planctomycetota bacterium]|nr:MAG: hypothetical protein CSA62_01075 [Planctomycetota bacterium]
MKLLLAVFSLLALLLPQDESHAVRDFSKAFKATRSGPRPVAERLDAIGKLAEYDSKRVTQALVEAFAKVEAEVQQVDSRRYEINQEVGEIRERVGTSLRFSDQKMYSDYRKLQEESSRLRKTLDNLRELQFELRKRLTKLKAEDSVEYLVKKVLTDKKQPLFLKLTIAGMAQSFDPELVENLALFLQKRKSSIELVPVLDTLGETKRIGTRLAAKILTLLKHKEEAVRERAALCLAKLEWRNAALPLIDLLEKEEGRTKKRIAAALAVLTGKDLGTMLSSWRGWWEKEGAEFMKNGRGEDVDDINDPQRGRPGLGRRAKNNASPGGTGYFGIPQDGKALIYVIDSSGSMKVEIDRKKHGSIAKGESANMTRLEACKAELVDTIKRLVNGKKFNVISYSDLPHQWKPKLVVANEASKKEAIAWVRALKPNSSTNIHDAMQMAFGLAGRGGRDKYYETEVDTIYLLSDGSPTTPDGKPDNIDKILKAVRTWNAMNRVTVHAIAIGQHLNVQFMQRLAAENGGEFRRALK